MNNSINLTPIEQEKLSFLSQNPEVKKEDYTQQINIYLLGVMFSCHFKHLPQDAYIQLKNYYQHFQMADHQTVDHSIVVYYDCFTDARATLADRWYCETYPQIHFLDEGPETNIIERDYVAKTADKLKTIFAFGPIPNEGNPDSLDNLLAMLFSSCNIHHQAILLHSATIIKNDKAWVFFGESGAGKSTLSFHAFKNFQNKVISSDQTILRIEGDKVLAQSTPITIPELPRDTPMRYWESIEVAGIIHLTKKKEAGFSPLSSTKLMCLFLGQSLFYLTPFSKESEHLETCKEILTKKGLKYGELAYSLGTDFWTHIPY